jgi:hypothetical protein
MSREQFITRMQIIFTFQIPNTSWHL